MEYWRHIQDFPGYSVSNLGNVKNEETGHLLALLRNQGGVVNVGLTRDRTQYKRGVALLVASAFLDAPEFDSFDTPINLDGDRSNNHVENLAWRPRWFAIRYFRQFETVPLCLSQPLEDVVTGKRYDTSWAVAITHGLLHRDLILSTLGYTPVWPTNQRFRVVYADID